MKRMNSSSHALKADRVQTIKKPKLPLQLMKYTLATMYAINGSMFFSDL